MSTAFVLSGGGSLGAVQVGMLRARLEVGVQPDVVIGSSVGALNGAWLAGRPDLAGVGDLKRIWESIGRGNVFPVNLLTGLRGFLGRRNHLVPPDALERLLRANLTYTRIEEAKVALHLVATDVTSGIEVLLSSGDLVPALLASAAIPGVFPPVRVDDHHFTDGGVVNNTPISHAVRLDATNVYVLSAVYACALTEPPRSALGMRLHAFDLLMSQRLLDDVQRYAGTTRLHVVPSMCPVTVSPVAFSQTTALIDRAWRSTQRWLAADEPNAERAQHVHRRPRDEDAPSARG